MNESRKNPRRKAPSRAQYEDLQRRLEEAEQTLEAIRQGDVDALVITGPQGGQAVYSLTGAEHVYRVIVETMNEAALTVDPDGTILFCNQRFCDLMKSPIHEAVSRKVTTFVTRPQQPSLKRLLADAQAHPVQQRLILRAADGTVVPVQLSASPLQVGETLSLCLVVSDLTELEESAHSIRVLREHEQAMQEANERLQAQSEELQVQAEELRAQSEELQTQAEELRTRTDELTATEAMLRESEERLALALSETRIGMYERDVATGKGQCTDYLAWLLGLRPLTPTTTPTSLSLGYYYHAWTRLVHPEDVPRVEAELRRCMAEHIPYEQDYRVLWPDSSVRWVADRGIFQYDSDGRCVRILGVVMDVTERKAAEEALRESEDRYRAFFQNSIDAVLLTSPDGSIYSANAAACQMFGRTEPEIIAGGRADVVDTSDPRLEAALEERAHTGRFQGELSFKRKDGSIFPGEISTSVFSGQNGQPRTAMIIRDVTERKQHEEALRQSEERYRGIVETAEEGIATHEPDGTITYVNQRMADMLGYSREEMIGRSSVDFVDDEDRGAVIRARASLKEQGSFSKERRLRRKDGSILWTLAHLSPRRDAAGNFLGYLAMHTDITERKRVEETLRTWNALLESKVAERTTELRHRARQLQKLTLEISETEDRERKRMAEILHDDLQQQLAATKFRVSVLRSRGKSEASMQATVAQIEQMLTEAIQKSRSLSHELSPAVMHHADLDETFRWLAGEVQARHGLVVHVQTRGEIRPESDALKSFLYKAAQEFLFNVVKHARVNEARLRVGRLGRYVYLSVSDRGRGFDPQGPRETAGFGLFSIRERIELLGGRMKIKSAQGQGSTFSIVVPDSPGSEDRRQTTEDGKKTKEGAPSSVLLSPFSVLRVLLADDHEIVRQGLRSLLSEQHDVEVVGEAANGREAVDLALRLKPDVVVMDMSMPVMEGHEATRQIKACLPQTRVIAISMYDQAEKIEAMYRAGAEGYVLKTASSEELLAAIRAQSAGET